MSALAVCLCPARGGDAPGDLARIMGAFLAEPSGSDWRSLEILPGMRWAPLPPRMLEYCLADGGCFTRAGKADVGGRDLAALATGARQIVNVLYLSGATALGETAVLRALRDLGFSAALARCPLIEEAGGAKWYRLTKSGGITGILSVDHSCEGQVCERFALRHGEELPPLEPAELKSYSEECAAPAGERKAVSTELPHEALARTLLALIPLATGPAGVEWGMLGTLPTGIAWGRAWPGGERPGALALAGRKFSVLASGTADAAKKVEFEEQVMHPRGEHVLGVLYSLGFAVRLVRCGPVYTASTNNWYSVRSAATHPVMLRQSIRYEGERVQDTYELRLDNTLPPREARDRDPGEEGCR